MIPSFELLNKSLGEWLRPLSDKRRNEVLTDIGLVQQRNGVESTKIEKSYRHLAACVSVNAVRLTELQILQQNRGRSSLVSESGSDDSVDRYGPLEPNPEENIRELPILISSVTSSYHKFNTDNDSNSLEISLSDVEVKEGTSDYNNDNDKYREEDNLEVIENTIKKCTIEDGLSGNIEIALQDNKALNSSYKIEDTITSTKSKRIWKEGNKKMLMLNKEKVGKCTDLNILQEKKEHSSVKKVNTDYDKPTEKLKIVKKHKAECQRTKYKEPAKKKRRISKDKTVFSHSNKKDVSSGYFAGIVSDICKTPGSNEITHGDLVPTKSVLSASNDTNIDKHSVGKALDSLTENPNADNPKANISSVTFDNKCNQQQIETCPSESMTCKEIEADMMVPPHKKNNTNSSKTITNEILGGSMNNEGLSDVAFNSFNTNKNIEIREEVASKNDHTNAVSKGTEKCPIETLNKIFVTDRSKNNKLPVVKHLNSHEAHNENAFMKSSREPELRAVKPSTEKLHEYNNGDKNLPSDKDNKTSNNCSENSQEVLNENTSDCNKVTKMEMVGATDKSASVDHLETKLSLEPNKILNKLNKNIEAIIVNKNNVIPMHKDRKDQLGGALHILHPSTVQKKKENIANKLRDKNIEVCLANRELEYENKLTFPSKENSASPTNNNNEINKDSFSESCQHRTPLKDTVKIKELDGVKTIKCKDIPAMSNELLNQVSNSITKEINCTEKKESLKMPENQDLSTSSNIMSKESASTVLDKASEKDCDVGGAIMMETDCEPQIDINELNKTSVFCKDLPLIFQHKKDVVKSTSLNNDSKAKSVKEPNLDKAAIHIGETIRRFTHKVKSLDKQLSARKRNEEFSIHEINKESKICKTLSCIQKPRPEITIRSVSSNLGTSSKPNSFVTSPTSNNKNPPDSSQSCNSAQKSAKMRTENSVSRSITSKSLNQAINNLVTRRNSAYADAAPTNSLHSNISGISNSVSRRNSACADAVPINCINSNIPAKNLVNRRNSTCSGGTSMNNVNSTVPGNNKIDNRRNSTSSDIASMNILISNASDNNFKSSTDSASPKVSLIQNQNLSVTTNNVPENPLVNQVNLTVIEDSSVVKSLGANTNIGEGNLSSHVVNGIQGETSLVRHCSSESLQSSSTIQPCESTEMQVIQNITNTQKQQQVHLPEPVRNLISNAVELILHFFYKPDIHTNANFIPKEIHHDIHQFLLSEGRSIECSPDHKILQLYLIFYVTYFGELTNMKINKLAELLHLAIADLNRRNERNTRALRLTSEVLRKEEMNRAECDYHEMLTVRGMRFGEIFSSVSRDFIGCEYAMVATLYFRIIQALLTIDKENCNYIFNIKELCKSLLEKCVFELSNTCKTFFNLSFETVTTSYTFVKQCLMSFYILGYTDAGTSEVLFFSEITPPISVWQLQQHATNLGFETLNFTAPLTANPSEIQTASTFQVVNQQRSFPLQEQNRTQTGNQEIQTGQQKVQRQQMQRVAFQQQELLKQRLQSHMVNHQNFSTSPQQKMQNPASQQQQQNCQSTQLTNMQALYNHLSQRQKQQTAQASAGTSTRSPASVQPSKPAATAIIDKPPGFYNITPQLKQDMWMNHFIQNKHLVASLVGNTTSRPINPQQPIKNPGYTSSRPSNVMVSPSGRHTTSTVTENTLGNQSIHPPSTSHRRDLNEINAVYVFEGKQGRQCERPGCTRIATVVCSLCKGRFYCRRECQSQDWYDSHSKICLE